MKFIKKIRNIILVSLLFASVFWMQLHEEKIEINLDIVPEYTEETYVV